LPGWRGSYRFQTNPCSKEVAGMKYLSVETTTREREHLKVSNQHQQHYVKNSELILIHKAKTGSASCETEPSFLIPVWDSHQHIKNFLQHEKCRQEVYQISHKPKLNSEDYLFLCELIDPEIIGSK
jgi:hypothetical protein